MTSQRHAQRLLVVTTAVGLCTALTGVWGDGIGIVATAILAGFLLVLHEKTTLPKYYLWTGLALFEVAILADVARSQMQWASNTLPIFRAIAWGTAAVLTLVLGTAYLYSKRKY